MASSYRARPGAASRAGSLPFFPQNHVGIPRIVSSWGRPRNKGRINETISRSGEDVWKLAMVTNPANE
ncbi:hypothetical protein IVA96_22875 [Bradyrhizobium sp. 159]|uniref:hypothetical protein n=1 Tax=unclassified Bradyrhizobium TaxID=2631580 RepID=UPI001FFB437E|nr:MULTISPECIES: hypothetical protein [unclassified Bradyrhizobium]MCK1619365.1 hypothetical protein [Bradyrhizobium sp. 159]MCK1754019.1 hypothetical protein [Bradyrhizobium sp. 137]